MQLKHMTLAALASFAFAKNKESTMKNLNATLSENDQLSNLTSYLALAPGLMMELSNATNITLLAPSNKAFQQLMNSSLASRIATDPGILTAVLEYHVLNGTYTASEITKNASFFPTYVQNSSYTNITGGQVVEAIMVDQNYTLISGLLHNSTITMSDQNFTGGVIHIIDELLVLPASVYETAGAANLTSLLGAANETNLLDTVNDTRNITLFAPTNDAFIEVSESLEKLSMDELKKVVGYHLVEGTVGYSSDLMNGTQLQSSNGATLEITIDMNGTIFVNSAKVIAPNLLVANGVMHVIDEVLNPNSTMMANTTATSGSPAFSTGYSNMNAPFTSGQPTPTTTINLADAPEAVAATGSGSGTSSKSKAGVMPQATGAIGYGALFGAGAAVLLGA